MVTFNLDKETNSYSAFENGLKLGDCSFKLDGYDMSIVSLSCDNEVIAEGLLRSSLNYGAKCGAYLAHITEDNIRPATQKLGFSANDFVVEIPDALMSCNCHNK